MENKTFRVNVRGFSMNNILKFINDIKIYVLENQCISIIKLIRLFVEKYDRNAVFDDVNGERIITGWSIRNILLNDIKIFPRVNYKGEIDSFDVLFPEIENISSFNIQDEALKLY